MSKIARQVAGRGRLSKTVAAFARARRDRLRRQMPEEFSQEGNMILGWFKAPEAKAFGTALARFYVERVPLEAQMNEKKFAAKTQEVLGKMARQVRDFKVKNKMGIYKKAQVGNAFKWTLKDAGYNEQYVEKLTLWLMTTFE
jgi:hypothetical protein